MTKLLNLLIVIIIVIYNNLIKLNINRQFLNTFITDNSDVSLFKSARIF